MAGNGGIIGPTKVISTSQTKTTTFTSSGTFSKLNCSSTARVLVVAGGGAGGANQPAGNSSGGGGAGGFRTNCSLSLTPGPITVTVGAGGAGVPAGPPSDGCRGGQGSQSIIAGTSLGDFISTGGGGGGGGASAASDLTLFVSYEVIDDA